MTRSERFSEVMDYASEYAESAVDRLNSIDDDFAVYRRNKEGDVEKQLFLGQVTDIVPSGKFYAPWSQHQTKEDVILDTIFFDELRSTLKQNGMHYFFEEDNPADLLVGKVLTEEEAEGVVVEDEEQG